MKKQFFVAITLLLLAFGFFLITSNQKTQSTQGDDVASFPGFRTDMSQASIPLDLILPGGPGKDGIPALFDPEFVDADQSLEPLDGLGILVSDDLEARFYPYSILVWHEIVNDTLSGNPIAVTYCPLCGTAITYKRSLGREILDFGVSGFLHESNMIMYDKDTESFWLQATGESVVGERVGQRLSLVDSDVMTFAEAMQKHPSLKVLSRDTGYRRDYDNPPYDNYTESDDLFFPVSEFDDARHPKTLMYVVPDNGTWFAFVSEDLEDGQNASESYGGQTYMISREGGDIKVQSGDDILPGYYEMWFSYAIHHKEDGVVWSF